MPTKGFLSSLLIAFVAVTAAAQEAVHTEPPVFITAIELMAEVKDADGKLPLDLKAEELTVIEDGVERKVIGVEYLDAQPGTSGAPTSSLPWLGAKNEWQVVVYFDALFSSTMNMRKISESLAERADELAAMGPVEIVVGDPKPWVALESTRDVEKIRAGLKKAVSKGAKDFLTVHRRRFIMDNDNQTGTPRRNTRPTTSQLQVDPEWKEINQPMMRLEQVRPYIMQELDMVRSFQRNLLDWTARYPRNRQRALMLISGGFEYDPAAYYFSFAQGSKDAQKAREEFSQQEIGNQVARMARTLAASSWTMISVDAPTGAGDQWIDDGGRSGIGRIRNLRTDDRGPGMTFTGTRTRDPLLEFADATGGSVVQRQQLGEAIAGLGQRVKITYQVSRPPDGKVRPVAVRTTRPGLNIRTLKWSSEATPDDVAAARVVAILRDGQPTGELPTKVNVQWGPATDGPRKGQIVIDSSLAPMAAAAPAKNAAFRVTILAREEGQQPMLIHRIVNDYDASNGTFRYTAPITAPANKLELIVAVEELATGVWGGGRALVQ